MLQISFFREQPERLRAGLKKRQFTAEQIEVLLNKVLELDDKRKAAQLINDEAAAEVNNLSREVGVLMKSGKKGQAEALKPQVAAAKERVKVASAVMAEATAALEEQLLPLPNLPHDLVVYGTSADQNEVFRPWEKSLPKPPVVSGMAPSNHWDLGEKYNLFDLKLGVKLTGAGFPVYRGKGAKLQRALINFFLDQAQKAGYEEVQPPLLVNEASARGTGQIPDKEGQMYHVTKDDLYLIPTAEVPITNIMRDTITKEFDLPLRMTGYTPCFRREAGSYGAHVRGLNRVHQFDKVEIVQFVHPDHSYKILMDMLDHVCLLMKKLELPYRILRLCSGDMGSAAAMTYDFEAWSGAQQRWLEVSSVSNFETFQSNRMKARYRDSHNKVHLLHTLNGSALALPRIMACLLENNNTAEGIHIPKALHKYLDFTVIN
jgi:seryl-tRNA synthetase